MSPAMHTAAFKQLHLDYVYGVFDVNEEMLSPLLSAIRKQNFRGANVTVPYKEAVIPLLDKISEEASVIGAVNTIVNNNGMLEGYNTDAFGIFSSLNPVKEKIEGNNVTVMGAGGGARAAVYTIAKHFSPKSITIVNRTAEHAKSLAQEFGVKYNSIHFTGIGSDSGANHYIQDSKLIVNATTVGMKPNSTFHPLPPSCQLNSMQIVFDIIYNPMQTRLMAIAKEQGAKTIGGIEMLIGQGIKAFQLFTHSDFPVETARDVLMKELGEGSRK